MSEREIIHVEVEKGDAGLFYATSPDMKGLLVAGTDRESLHDEVAKAISEIHQVQGAESTIAVVLVPDTETLMDFAAFVGTAHAGGSDFWLDRVAWLWEWVSHYAREKGLPTVPTDTKVSAQPTQTDG